MFVNRFLLSNRTYLSPMERKAGKNPGGGAENSIPMLLSLPGYILDCRGSHLHVGEPAGLIPWVPESIDFLSLSKGIFQLPDPDCHVVWSIGVS